MTTVPVSSARARGDGLLLLALGGLGAIYLGLLVIAAWTLFDEQPIGWRIYDAYYSALLEGHLDLSARLLRFEGHYAPDGTGYLYHGLAPLLTRFAFGWIWSFEWLPMNGASIWLWGVIGTLGWQSVAVTLARAAGVWDRRRDLVLALCLALWVAGPAALLVVNLSFYHEPIAVAFAMTGLFAAVWTGAACSGLRLGVAVVLLAGCAAIALHARPNVAIGLYTGTLLAIGWGLYHARAGLVLPAILAMAVLGAGGLIYLGVNVLRFGDVTASHGSFGSSRIVYGNIYWGFEAADSERAAAFVEHGRFNILRVVPNAVLYFLDIPPRSFLLGPSEAVLSLFRAVTVPILGFIRVEAPRIGLLVLWPLWCLLAISGFRAARRDPKIAALVATLAISAGMTFAYGTVTFRYRLDLWPLLAVLAFLGATARMQALSERTASIWSLRLYLLAFMVGIVVTAKVSQIYTYSLRDWSEDNVWSEDTCLKHAARIGLSNSQGARTCRPPPFFEDAR